MSEVESLASSIADLTLLSETEHHRGPQSLHVKPPSRAEKLANSSNSVAKITNSLQEKGLQTNIQNAKQQHEITSAIGSDGSSSKVPKSLRRGFFSSLTLIPEYYDARTYLLNHKLIIVCIVSFAAFAGPMGTSIMLPATEDLSRSLDTPVSMVNISVGVYLLSLGIFPLWWSNFSERHGRRSVYVVSFFIFFAFSIGCAVAPSIESLIILRLFSGVGGSAVQACGAGTIADLYVQEQRGAALGIFYLGPLLGPFISPILGGAVAVAWGWRATMWVMVIVGGLNLLLIIFLLPETLPRDDVDSIKKMLHESFDKSLPAGSLERIASNISQHTSQRRQMLDEETPVDLMMPTVLRLTTNQSSYSRRVKDQELNNLESAQLDSSNSWWDHFYDYTIRPLHAIVFLTFPPILLVIAYSSIGFMGIYFFNITISNSYSKAPYNFSPVIVGLMYIPNSVTYVLASIYGGRWNDWLIKRSARLNDGELRPESRISWNLVVAIAIYPPACMIFGWCLDKKQHWVTPLIGSALFGFASMLVIGTTVTYLIDLLPGKGATGVALNNLVRQILAATATFITEPLISALGIGVLFSIYAGVVTFAALAVWVLKKKGASLREKYDITGYYAKL